MTVTNLPRAAAKQPQPYREHDIILTENFKFAVVFDDREHPDYCESLDDAHKRIDAHFARKAKQNKAKTTTKLPYAAVSVDGRLLTGLVKGFHASTGNILTANGELETSSWYPDTPMIREDLTELGRLRTQARALEGKLQQYKLSGKPAYGRTSAERYDEVLAGIVKDYELKAAKARAASLKVA